MTLWVHHKNPSVIQLGSHNLRSLVVLSYMHIKFFPLMPPTWNRGVTVKIPVKKKREKKREKDKKEKGIYTGN